MWSATSFRKEGRVGWLRWAVEPRRMGGRRSNEPWPKWRVKKTREEKKTRRKSKRERRGECPLQRKERSCVREGGGGRGGRKLS